MSVSPTNADENGDDDGQSHYEVDQRQKKEIAEDLVVASPLSRSTGSSGTIAVTRTVAIIKSHALNYRFDIERRIQEASFEIVKERQMEFDTETDPDTLYELFGEDTDALAEGPVWVYVLERRRAVEVWNTLMGDPNVNLARYESPNSLRALYGISRQRNGLMGSPDTQTAEIQIAALFASSPPFPTTELPSEDDADQFGSMRSVASSVLEQVRKMAVAGGAEDEGYAPSSATDPSTAGGGSQGKLNANGKRNFKARPVPSTIAKPDIVPRTTKAAALRAGVQVEQKGRTSGPRPPISKDRLAQTFANVPGHKRSSTIAVASTAPPVVAPRMTKAASLRLGQTPVAPPVRKRASTNEEKKATFDGVPGHKRRETISVASVKAPTVAPRLNKSAALRVQKELQVPPSSFMFKSPTISRSISRNSTSSLTTPQLQSTRPASQASAAIAVTPSHPKIPVRRSASVLGTHSPSKLDASSGHIKGNGTAAPVRPAAAKTRPRPSSIAAPSITPRLNKSSALRAAKQEAEQAAAAKAAVRKGRPKLPPSSFKTVVK